MLAVAIDYAFGEPRKYHPLVGFGRVASAVEGVCWRPNNSRGLGAIALLIMLFFVAVPTIMLTALVHRNELLLQLVTIVGLYIAIAPRSLREHAIAVASALNTGPIELARGEIAKMVSRDTQSLAAQEISSACCESILENGSDGVFAALFWFCVPTVIAHGHYEAGLLGVVIYRAVNTLDAMWGYKDSRYRQFGWATARMDDLLNYIPARLVALSYATLGQFNTAMHCWFTQAKLWKSPNAGPVMAAGAGSLQIILGGAANYDGQHQNRPTLGAGSPAQTNDINRALSLVNRTLVLWLVCLLAVEWALNL